MKYCTKCGKELLDEAVICPGCGCAVEPSATTTEMDAPSMWLAVVGFFVPLAGLILYLANKEKSPKKAKSAGKGALTAFCVISIFFGIIFFIASFGRMWW